LFGQILEQNHSPHDLEESSREEEEEGRLAAIYSQRTTEAGFIKRPLQLMSVNRSGHRNTPATVNALTVAGGL